MDNCSCQTTEEYTFFPKCKLNIYKDKHILGHEKNLKKFKIIKIIQSLFSKHNRIKLKTNNKKIRTSPNIWKLNNTLLYNPWQRENLKKLNKFFEFKENSTCQNMWDAVKAVHRGRFIALNVYIRNQERCQINEVSFNLKKLGKSAK